MAPQRVDTEPPVGQIEVKGNNEQCKQHTVGQLEILDRIQIRLEKELKKPFLSLGMWECPRICQHV